MLNEYKKKLITAEKAAALVKSGDIVDYGFFNGKPVQFDKALASRSTELNNVSIYTAVTLPPVPEVSKLPGSFIYHDWHFSKVSRLLNKATGGKIYYSPIMFSQAPSFYRKHLVPQRTFACCQVCPMDEHGWFNLGPQNSETLAKMEMADTVILEINKNMPVCLGGSQEAVHISTAHYLIEAPDDQKLPDLPGQSPSDLDKKVASNIMQYIHDGCCIQLGIGGMPNAVGHLISQSDLKNLGGHTEMFVDAYVEMIESGKMNGSLKKIDRNRAAYTFALGSQKMYDFMNNNPAVVSYPVDYTNDIVTISSLDNFVSINNAVEVDLYSQVNAESDGTKQISGNGGMLDFVLGAQRSEGGKSVICLASTYTDSEGKLKSRIVPRFGDYSITTIPRQAVDIIVTEFGSAQLRGKPTYQRAEMLIELAHPDFRDELIKDAEAMQIWRKSNKK